jgi:hypothetical protein
MATHVEEDGLRPLAQGRHIDARRHRKQNMTHTHAFSRAVGAFVRGMVPTARVFRRFGKLQRLLQQRIDGAGCRFADHAVGGGRIARSQQAIALRSLAQQFRAGALAQFFGREGCAARIQGYAVDPRDALLRHGRRAGAAGCGPGAG